MCLIRCAPEYSNPVSQPMDQTRLEVPCVAEQADYLMLVQDSEDVTPNEKHDSYMVPDSHRDNTEEQVLGPINKAIIGLGLE